MRRFALLVLTALLCAPVLDGWTQQATLPEAAVRYDTDLLSPAFHQDRRAAVRQALPDHAVAVFFSTPVRKRENDVDFEYHQSSDLYYLTGMHEPASVLLLAPGGIEVDGESVTELLMVPPRNPMREVWEGRRLGAERAQTTLGLEKVVSNEHFEEVLTALAGREDLRFFHLPLPRDVDPGSTLGKQIALFKAHASPLEVDGNFMVQWAVRSMLTSRNAQDFTRFQPIIQGRIDPALFEDSPLEAAVEAYANAASFDEWKTWKQEHLDPYYPDGYTLRNRLDQLRMLKTDAELALLQRAVDITTAAHREAMKSIEPGMYEYEAEALIEYIFRRNGAESPGFPSIVGSGENAVVLHYNTNRRQMQADDMVVIDIGAEYHGYSADVTRSLPVDGTFSPEQKIIYELVLKAQQAGIAETRAGQSFRAPHSAAARIITEGLLELGLIQNEKEVRTFFMHGTSHYLGLYVHDVGTRESLVPGTVITVEPGIYISPSPEIDPKWWNIGVRIEDDVLVTGGDPVVMSISAPRTVEDIEALMRQRGLGNEPAGVVERDAKAGEPVRGSQ